MNKIKSASINSNNKVEESIIFEKNILLVEDNIINQRIIILSLKNIVRKIDVANNGEEALNLFKKEKYDLILMDLQMPVMDGFVATKRIREIENTNKTHTPIIAVTANALLGDRDKCIDAGMDDYISKPFKIDVLIDKMAKLILK
ncbi:MAG: response regulator [Bacteroidales bacterium]|nr:response regulator [Bacteroidales bacterium]